MRRILAAALALLSVTFLVGACSTSKKLEDGIGDLLSSQFSAKDVKVDCPSNVKAEKGATAECTATGDFGSLGDVTAVKFHVTFTDSTHFEIDDATPLDSGAS